ncbi:peptide chain release factor 3 [Acetivibrio mesophilus]|uniref:Peptide chain release factor 3 n=1 Tax=Acetivibrio mesophilus TaxID=2487273 RepID=A0A4V1K2A3_9FIRM|nr:peptide chain release factor 3 [Acetivibrio mesophilus]ODM25824.1 peptide chain release factor 3 [Clostridium sp. Bc-iso-3]RXE59589.1 peptide chain release factor 3 [Acetivibrio mesophilus]HHV30517.1 peptide chain release factor 3 [Clostridium sp.]
MQNKISHEVERRRTFAIISHPDAGKTTMTEKLLLYGGAIRLAGSVKARKANKYATSDWMEIEKQRGISVTSSVMQFEYNNYCINILDTPGHQDFSEDTYRTLMAADSAVMLIDGAKGVEEQTIKLFHVCKMRGIPIFTFVNKMDRASKDPFELMEELENVLGIRSYPMNWPIGTDGDFKGVYNRKLSQIELFEGGNHGQTFVSSTKGNVDDKIFADLLGEHYHNKLCEDIELLDIAGDVFDRKKIQQGELTPMFFGSAMTNFGVQPFLEEFLELSPKPGIKNSSEGEVDPESDKFTGFVFKIQANMNPAHRDRIAFIRICSGRFTRGMSVYHVQQGKEVRLSQPQQFMAQERTIIEEAYPGDIIGVFDPGIFHIGDTLSEGNSKLRFEGIPIFPAEHFARVTPVDTMKRKQFLKGINQLSEEGTIQVFKQIDIGVESLIVGTVGVLQFEVLEYRLKNEYGVDLRIQQLPHRHARWIMSNDIDPRNLTLTSSTMIANDDDERYVLLFENEWSIRWAEEKNPSLKLQDIAKKDFNS